MTDASDATHFSVTYSEDELKSIGRLISRLRAQGNDDNMFYGLVFGVPLAIGFIVYGAFALGLITTTEVPPVLASAYIAFVAGWMSYRLWIRRYYRKYGRSDRNLGPWNYAFDDVGILYRNETTEVRITWRGVDAANDLGWIVLLRFGHDWVSIPGRMFADNAARKAFVAACAARIKTAAESAQA